MNAKWHASTQHLMLGGICFIVFGVFSMSPRAVLGCLSTKKHCRSLLFSMTHNSQSCESLDLHWHQIKRELAHQQRHVCRRVAAFVDIEAEASNDEAEEESADDPEEEATEADAMFVNDASPGSIRTQPERGCVLVP